MQKTKAPGVNCFIFQPSLLLLPIPFGTFMRASHILLLMHGIEFLLFFILSIRQLREFVNLVCGHTFGMGVDEIQAVQLLSVGM